MNTINCMSRRYLTFSHAVLAKGRNKLSTCQNQNSFLLCARHDLKTIQKWIHVTSISLNGDYSRNRENMERITPQRATGQEQGNEQQEPRVRFHKPRYPSPLDNELLLELATQKPIPRHLVYIEDWIKATAKSYEPGKTVIDWKEVLQKGMEIHNSIINERNFGSFVLGACIRHEELYLKGEEKSKENFFEIGRDYIKWVGKPTLLILTTYMKLCSFNMDKVSEKAILRMYDTVLSKTKGVWTSEMAINVIQSILKTSKWKESIDVFRECEKSGNRDHYKAKPLIVSKAFEEKEFELGWSLLNEKTKSTESYYMFNTQEPFVSFLRNCPPTEENIKKVLDFLDIHEWFPFGKLTAEIRRIFEEHLNYKIQVATINPTNRMCLNCKKQLNKNDLTPEEFKRLQQHFLQKVVLTEDVFINSTPDEVQDYQEFLAKYGPFDVVLDGLNIAFSHSKGRADSKNIDIVASKLFREGKKILIIGRQHMNKWPPRIMKSISQNGYLFLIDNKSNDDPFIIYGTLNSGPNSTYISKDFMRQHSFQLNNPEVARLFKRWRLTHQMDITWNRGYFHLNPFSAILPVSQKNSETGIYHIPFEVSEGNYSPYQIPSQWMCLTPKKS